MTGRVAAEPPSLSTSTHWKRNGDETTHRTHEGHEEGEDYLDHEHTARGQGSYAQGNAEVLTWR
jgi:hypothetical protein